MSPLAYLFKHGGQLLSLMQGGKTQGGHIITDLLTTNAPILKRWWPKLAENDLLDDTIAMLKGQL